MHNSKTIGCMSAFYIRSKGSTIEDLPFLVYNRRELRLVTYSPKHTLLSVSDTPFCAYFKYNSKNTRCLQVYYTPNDSTTTDNALFHVKSGKAVATNKLQPVQTLLSCYLVHKYEWQQTQGAYDCIITQYQSLSYQGCIFQKHKLKSDLRAVIQRLSQCLCTICRLY